MLSSDVSKKIRELSPEKRVLFERRLQRAAGESSEPVIPPRGAPEAERTEQLMHLLKKDAGRPFDLARDLKLRTTLCRLAEQEYILLHVSHHISWDLRSKVIFYQELTPLYQAYSEGKSCQLP